MCCCLHILHTQIDVPVIPGLGLYLDELFFDKYNVKIDYEIKKVAAAATNREAKRQRKESEQEVSLDAHGTEIREGDTHAPETETGGQEEGGGVSKYHE